MEITAITRYKHGELYAILKRLGWTQAELARRCGLDARRIGGIINISKRPSQKTADLIQKTFGEAGEYFDVLEQWPELFAGLGHCTKKEETMDVPMECLLGCREAMMLPSPEQDPYNGLKVVMGECLETLTEREKYVLEERFYQSRTLNDVANDSQFGKGGRERVRQIEARALRKIRHPMSIRTLEPFAGAFLAKKRIQ